MIRIDNLKIRSDISEEEVISEALKKHRISPSELLDARIIKKSIDARDKKDVHYVYALDVSLKNENRFSSMKTQEIPADQVPVRRQSSYPPVIIGSGPAGLFCALELIENGITPIIVEQGAPADQRIRDVSLYREKGLLNPLSNVQFGEGGAGTFSDGKLTTNIRSPLIRKVLDTFVRFGASREISYLSKPHVGTDNLVSIVQTIRRTIEQKGGKYYFHTRFLSYQKENGLIRVICDKTEFLTDALILAIGHSAFDTFAMLQEKNVRLERKVFAVGLRIEHLQEKISLAQYGPYTKLRLPPADYKLAYHGDRSCFSFCMCPGGEVIASASEEGSIVTNGMSNFARAGKNANAALLVNVAPGDFAGSDPLEGMRFQRQLEHFAFALGGNNSFAPVQRLEDFLLERKSERIGSIEPTYRPGYTLGDLNTILPSFISKTIRDAIPYFDRRIHGYNDPNAILTGVETRSSSPVTIVRNDLFQSSEEGIYPCGEGAGYAGGITTAAIDGIKCARAVLENPGFLSKTGNL